MRKAKLIAAVVGISVAGFAYQNCAQKLPDLSDVQASAATSPVTSSTALFSTLTGFQTAGHNHINALAQAADLSLYSAGFIQSDLSASATSTTTDAFINKMSATGQLLWAKSYGGASQDQFNSLIVLADGNLLAAGATRSFVTGTTETDGFMVKVDATSGAVMWAQTYRTPGNEQFLAARELANGDLIVAGFSTRTATGIEDALIMRTDSVGAVTWSKVVGGAAGAERFTDLQLTVAGGVSAIVAGGFTQSYGQTFPGVTQREGMLVRFDLNGAILWSRILGGTVEDRVTGISEMADLSAYVVALKINAASSGGSDTVVAKLGLDGTTLLAVSLAKANYDVPFEIARTLDGNFVVGSVTENSTAPSTATSSTVRLTKVSSAFNAILWNREFGRPGINDSALQTLVVRKDGGYAVGMTSSTYSVTDDSMTIQTDADGKINSSIACAEMSSPELNLSPVTISNAAFTPNVNVAVVLTRTNVIASIVINNLTYTQINACVP